MNGQNEKKKKKKKSDQVLHPGEDKVVIHFGEGPMVGRFL